MTDSREYAPNPNDIAVVGMAAHLPDAPDVETYWKNLRSGHESVRSFSEEDLLAAGATKAELRNSDYVRAGIVLDGVEDFDAGFFGFTPKDAAIMDPQHRHFLECAWEALSAAGHYPKNFDGAIGVFAGCGMGSYFMFNVLSNPKLVEQVGMFLLRHTGNDKDFLSTRVSYDLDLQGPSINVQTACSTSAVAVHLAAQSLLSGECDMALAGGVTILVPHNQGYVFHEGEVLSPDGHCRAFDEKAKGTIFGSGAGVVCLRRMEDALADGDRVLAVLKGSAVNNDGSGKVGYLAPSVDGHAAAISEAIEIAGLTADDIGYVETHGTGTAVGDPIEITALTQAYRETTQASGYCRLGSVKTNIGHLDTAAGIASLIKVIQALRHRELPPSLNFDRPNPAIDFPTTPFAVNTELTPWESDSLRRAGISSLGVGGTNAHLIIEEAPEQISEAPHRNWQIFPISAKSAGALTNHASRLASWFEDRGDLNSAELADAAWTLQIGRESFEHRRVIVAENAADAASVFGGGDASRTFSSSTKAKGTQVAFLLPGGGAQHPGMGADLYADEPVYREAFDACLAALDSGHAETLRRLVLQPAPQDDEKYAKAADELERMSLQLPAIYATSWSLAKLYESWGVKPEALIGHSLGENTAAAIAGVISRDDGMRLVTLRGKLFEKTAPGAILSVELSAEEMEKRLPADVGLAIENGPELVAVSGPEASIEALEAELREAEVEVTRIRVSTAAHSSLLDPILPEFGDFLRSIQLSPPRIPFVSNRTGDWITDAQATDPEYWVAHLRGTVHFSAGIQKLAEKEHALVEVGPGKTLSSLARLNCGPDLAKRAFNAMRHRDEKVSDTAFALNVIGKLWCAGVEVDWKVLHEGSKRLKAFLPGYSFDRQRYWIDPGKAAPASSEEVAQEISKIEDLGDWFSEPVWVPAELSGAQVAAKRILVFGDEREFCTELRRTLEANGAVVDFVHPGERFESVGEREYTIRPTEREHADQLLEMLVSTESLPDVVLHAWAVTESDDTEVTTSFFHQMQERGFYSLLFFAQAWSEQVDDRPLRLCVASNGMQALPGEELIHPVKAALLGPVRVIAREFGMGAGAFTKSVDLVLPKKKRFGSRQTALSQLTQSLFEEATRYDAEDESERVVALRAGARYVESFESRPLEPAPQGTRRRLKDGGAYLVTGGMGGIGLEIAAEIASAVEKPKLALLGRSALPPREHWNAWLAAHGGAGDSVSRRISSVRQLEALGAQVLPLSADVANLDELSLAIDTARDTFGRIDGVLHAAGTIEDEVIAMKDPASVDKVFTPKIHGTLLLDRLLQDDPLDFFCVFSSTSSFLGLVGQVDYTAANAFLNAFARSRNRADRYVTAVMWGIWRDVGMAAEALGAAGRSEAEREIALSSLGDEAGNRLLGRLVLQTERELCYVAEYRTRDIWVLNEHRLATGEALIPGTGYLEIARAALKQAGQGERCEISGVTFLSPLGVRDDEVRRVRVSLEMTGDEGRQNGHAGTIPWSFEVASRGESEPEWTVHATGEVRSLGSEAQPEAPKPEELRKRCSRGGVELTEDGRVAAQAKYLAFGPRWQVLRHVGLGEGEAIAELALSPEFAADLSIKELHPGLMDLATGFGLPLIPGYESSAQFYAPMSYGRVSVFSALPAQFSSWLRLRPSTNSGSEIAHFDVTLMDEEGRVLVEVEDFCVRRIEDTSRLAARPENSGASGTDAGSGGGDDGPLRVLLEEGIRPAEGREALRRILAQSDSPAIVVSSLPLDGLREYSKTRHAGGNSDEDGGAHFARPELETNFVEARDEVERVLCRLWSELLGVDRVGIQDDFFELGGYSLIAVRLFAKVKKEWKLEFPLSILFEAPTVERLAVLVRDELGIDLNEDGEEASSGDKPKRPERPRYTHLVPMHTERAGQKKSERPPFFLCAGMFGNVMNLRHLAGHIGQDQPFYGLQAKGVDGKSTPHETFEEMATSYLEEMRQVQPEGPYYLGGFSGGGIVAYEIARQLKAQGESVGCLVLLDTWLPQEKLLSYADRRAMHKQRFQQQGLKYAGGILWNRLMRNKKRLSQIVNSYLGRVRPYEFSESNVELAFRRALVSYDTPRWAEDVILFRPKLDIGHVLPSGNMVNSRANYIWEDNGWSQYVDGKIEVVEVPGDHDSMVLEPQVRVLADRLRAVLIEAERDAEALAQEEAPKGALRGSSKSADAPQSQDPSELPA